MQTHFNFIFQNSSEAELDVSDLVGIEDGRHCLLSLFPQFRFGISGLERLPKGQKLSAALDFPSEGFAVVTLCLEHCVIDFLFYDIGHTLLLGSNLILVDKCFNCFDSF